jgi:hypothetical protein
VSAFYGIGPQVINDCVSYGTVTGTGALISFITYGNTSCSCITPTPTPTATALPPTDTPTPTPTGVPPTDTPTPTPTSTPVPPTNTPTPTPTAVPSVNVVVNSQFSLDIGISDVTVNSVAVSYVTGFNFPVDAGEEGTFQTTQTGTQTVIVYYSSSITGQNITLVDSNGGTQCAGTNTGSNSITFNDVAINSSGDVFITATDGACA